MLGALVVQAQTIQDSAMCYGYGATDLQPIGAGDTIFEYTEKIGLWVQIQTPPDVQYRVVWEDPSGSQFRNAAVTVIDKSGEDWGIIFDSINIAESTASNKLGLWKVTLFIDGEETRAHNFQIISYEDLVEDIQDIQEQVQNIVEEKDELLAQNAALEASLQVLQADYEALQAQVGTSSDYEQLKEDYDVVLDDYNALKASQSSTRTMMYAAIVVAVIAIVVAVYFGAIKK
jgi:GGDEF domain-containing protein